MEESIRLEIGFQKEHEKISKIYTKIYTLIFRFTLSVLGILASFLITDNLINSSKIQNIYIFPDIDNAQTIKKKLTKDFKTNINQSTENKEINIEIMQGKLYEQGDSIYSINNLIKYRGYTMPNIAIIHTDNSVQEIEYFNSDDYDIKELEEFFGKFIFINRFGIDSNIQKNQKLILEENIEKTFNMGCIFENKITDRLCNHYLSEFLKYFYIYDLSKDIQGLEKISNQITQTAKAKDFCQGIKNYIIYSKQPKNYLKKIIDNCSNTIPINEFNKLNDFLEVQKELEEGYTKEKYYTENEINYYKLLSTQQIIYNDIESKRINNIRINNYINFLKNLLKKNDLDQFYKEQIYWFNNYFLIKNIENIKTEATFSFIKELNSINRGESILGIKGLSSQIKNKELATYQKREIRIDLPSNTKSIMENLLQGLNDLSFYTPTKNLISGDNQIISEGYLHVGKRNIRISTVLERSLNNLIIKDIKTTNYQSLNQVLNNFISSQNRNLNRLYQYITENIDSYITQEESEINDIGICEILQSIKNHNVIECSEETIFIQKAGINYIFLIKENEITNLDISNEQLQEQINNQLKNITYKNLLLHDTIKDILNYELPESEITGNPNSIIISEIFQKYLGIKPNDVIESKGNFFLNFKLQNINFIAQFEIKTKTIKALYFQEVTQNGRPLNIKNFELFLDDKNRIQINQFLINPINYIKNIDSFAYINYENKFGDRK